MTQQHKCTALFETDNRYLFFWPWTKHGVIGISFRLPWEHFIEPTQRTVLTGRNSDASRDADTVVNDSEHVDVVLYACLQA